MRPWYLLPETVQRPIVISVWGRTGVGKTSVVIRLVELLKLESRFGHEDLGKFMGHQRDAQAEDLGVLEKFSMLSGQAPVFLFDEIQTTRSVDASGAVDQPKLRDFWNFLDTGKLQRDTRSLEGYVLGLIDRHIAYKQNPPTPLPGATIKITDLGISQWDIEYMRHHLGLSRAQFQQFSADDPIQFLEWAAQRLRERMAKLAVADFSRSLVFVAGNLDALFEGAGVTDPDQVTLDEIHALDERRSMNDVKAALLKLFRPEQVARLGSLHLIFPGFSRADFERLIQNKLAVCSARLEALFGLKLAVDNSITDLFLDEAMIPSQGARPLLALIKDFIESQVPNWILGLRMADIEETVLKLHYDRASGILSAESDASVSAVKRFESKPRIAQTALRKVQANPILRKIIAVHEAGHAVVGTTLLGMLPERVHCSSVKPMFGGHVEFTEPPILNLKLGMANLANLLGGMAAEELVFGKGELTNGSQIDLKTAMRLVSEMISQYAMGDHIGLSGLDWSENLTFLKKSDDKIKERWLQGALKEARQTLRKQSKFFHAIAEHLALHPELTAEQFKALFFMHYRGSDQEKQRIVERKYAIPYEAYNEAADAFLKSKK
jgi:hypothetical protein